MEQFLICILDIAQLCPSKPLSKFGASIFIFSIVILSDKSLKPPFFNIASFSDLIFTDLVNSISDPAKSYSPSSKLQLLEFPLKL